MKKICCLLAYFCLNAVSAQDFDGVYMGKIVSEKNVLVVSTTAGTAVGTIHFNKAEKTTFIGTIANGTLSGSFGYGGNSWSLTGKIRNDSLIMHLTSAKESLSTGLKRLSSNTSFKLSKLLNEAPPNDTRLIGTWRTLYAVKDGVIKPPDRKTRDVTVTYNSGGTCQYRSTELDKLYATYPKAIQVCNWETRGDKLSTIMHGGSGSKTIEGYYLIKGDTLIVTYKGTDSYFLRSGK